MTSNFNEEKSDMMKEIDRRESESRQDKWIWWLLAITFIFFTFHVGMAFATSTPPVIQCWNNGFGTIQCAPI
jgi:uncharacterized membrane protein